MGRNSLREILRHDPGRVERVFALHDRKDADSGKSRQQLLSLISKEQLPIQYLSHEELSKLVGSESHQGFVAVLKDRTSTDLKSFLKEMDTETSSVVLMLDGVNDPQNLGTILRAADCFGADAVIWSKNRGAGISPVVAKTSVGASELMRIIEVSNLVEVIRKFKDAGYWVVAGDATAETDIVTFEFPGKTLLIAGSEGSGVRELTRKNVDFMVKIPLFGNIESLNVSQAVAVMLHRYRSSIVG